MELFNVQQHGFEGRLFEPEQASEKKCLILNLMFAPDSFMLKKTSQWLVANGVSALNLASWGTKQTVPDENLIPLDYLLKACTCLKERGYRKIGVAGISLGAVMALYGASLCSDISLTISISGFDVLFEGVVGRGVQWPSGHSSLTLNGKELPYQPLFLNKESYQTEMKRAKKEHGETYGRGLWENALLKDRKTNAVVPVEKIKGKLLLLSAERDTCWDSAGASERIQERIKEKGGSAEVVSKVYAHATHMLYPETVPMINFMTKMVFKEMKQYPKECKDARRKVSQEILNAVLNW